MEPRWVETSVRAPSVVHRWRQAVTVGVCGGAVLALALFSTAAPRPVALRIGPLRADHVISHRPADDCNYVGAPEAQPGDVWMDSMPSGFLLTYTSEGHWLPMCVNGFSDASASVSCRMLGFQGASTHFNSQLHNASVHGLAPGVSCQGSETTLADCARDPDFEKSWSDCRKYPEAMAVHMTCYGDIASRRENNYELAQRFTPELKTAVRKCGSSQVLTNLYEDIRGAPAAASGTQRGSRGGASSASSSSSNSNLGKILGPVLGTAGGIGIAAGTAAGARNNDQLRMPLTGGADGTPAATLPIGYSAQTTGDGSCPCARSIVADLRELAKMRDDGLLTQEEYTLAKARVLGR